jgi:hypothetical protein
MRLSRQGRGEVTALDDLRAQLGPGPAFIVRATTPPSHAVWVANERVQLTMPHCVNDRIDLLCITAVLGEVHAKAVTGTPACSPVAPTLLPQSVAWLPVATVRVRACSSFVSQADIEEWHP